MSTPPLLEIRAAAGRYPVCRVRGGLAAALPAMRAGVVIADAYFATLLAERDVAAIALPASEQAKSLDAIGDVIVRLRAAGATRSTHLWAVGGGVIQDVAGFVASIYMRGLAWTYLPTTLLGMVDSCIGGKSSINVGACKNIVGTFHIPGAVLIDPQLIATLSTEQRVAGLAEAAKICFCRGPERFAAYLAQHPAPALAPAAFEPIIDLSLGAKQWFIETDEFDRGERLLLNFGHTFGHALEAASGFRLSHGIAVGVGVLCALALGRLMAAAGVPADVEVGMPEAGETARLAAHMRALLAAFGALPDILRGIDLATTLERLRADKKHQAAHYRFVTTDPAGRVQLVRLARTAASEAAILAALRETLDSLCQ